MSPEQQSIDSTRYSMSLVAPSSEGDRRADERHLTLYRVGTLQISDGGRELCLIKNVSAGGMKIRAYCEVSEGQPVSIELKNGQPIRGVVHWISDKDAGVQFDEPIDIVDVLSQSMTGPKPRMPRIEIDCPVLLRCDAEAYRARSRDISQGGIKIDGEFGLPVGSQVTVQLPNWGTEPGAIIWIGDGCCGVAFNRTLPLALLVDWLRANRTVTSASA